jgi:hypothetical protein
VATQTLSGVLIVHVRYTQLLRAGRNRIYTPYMTVYMVMSLPKIPYAQRIYMVLANPINVRYTQLLRVGQNRVSVTNMTRLARTVIYALYITLYLVIFLPITPYIHRIHMVLANPVYDRMYGDFPAKNAVCTPYIL